ncbi:MAG: ATP synthase F1 subunit delta [Candidatus Omnitrophota bacterium]
MKNNTDFLKYACAVSRLAKDKTEREEIYQNLIVFDNVVGENPELAEFLKHPGIAVEEKLEMAQSIFKEGGFVDLSRDFLKLLIAEKKIDCLKNILEKYHTILRVINRQIHVVVETAFSAEKKTLEEIKDVLSRKFDREIILGFSENRSLIGGFRVIADGQVFDGSVKGELKRMEEILK